MTPVRGASSRPVLVVLGSTPYSGHQLYDQRLARAMSGRFDVVYVEPALPLVSRTRGTHGPENAFLRREPDGIVVSVPRMLPFGRRRLLAGLTAVVVAGQVWVTLLRSGRRNVHRVVTTEHHPWTVRLLRASRSVYLVKDDYVAGATLIGESTASVAARRRALVGFVDHIVVVSPHLARVFDGCGPPVTVLPPGCEALDDWSLPEPAELAPLPRPRALFIGLISDRIDFDALVDIVDNGGHVVAVGGVHPKFSEQDRIDSLVARGGLTVLPARPPDRVGQLALWCDAGLVPYVDSEFNRASFPLKTFEYLADGLPVISTPLESVRSIHHERIVIAETPEAFGRALGELFRDGPAPVDVRRASADHVLSTDSWEVRARRWLSEVLGFPCDVAAAT